MTRHQTLLMHIRASRSQDGRLDPHAHARWRHDLRHVHCCMQRRWADWPQSWSLYALKARLSVNDAIPIRPLIAPEVSVAEVQLAPPPGGVQVSAAVLASRGLSPPDQAKSLP